MALISEKFIDAMSNFEIFVSNLRGNENATLRKVLNNIDWENFIENQNNYISNKFNIPIEYIENKNIIFERKIFNLIEKGLCNFSYIIFNYKNDISYEKFYNCIKKTIMFFEPDESKITPGNLAIKESSFCYMPNDMQGWRDTVSGRFGRRIRYMFPELPDQFIDVVCSLWKDSFGEKIELFGHVGCTAGHFRYAYTQPISKTGNVFNGIYSKSLADSCMQKPVEEDFFEYGVIDVDVHPVEAYATDKSKLNENDRQFEIAYVTNKENPFAYDAKIYGRVLFSRTSKGFWEIGPIYSSDNNGNEFLKKFIIENQPNDTLKIKIQDLFHYEEDYDYMPNSYWDNVCITPIFRNTGKELTLSLYKEKSKNNEGINLITPYLDKRYKNGYAFYNEEDDSVILKILNNPQIDMNENPVIEFINYRGLNYLNKIKIKIKCDCCENKEYENDLYQVHHYEDNEEKIKYVCYKCHYNDYFVSSLTNNIIKKDNNIAINLLSFSKKQTILSNKKDYFNFLFPYNDSITYNYMKYCYYNESYVKNYTNKEELEYLIRQNIIVEVNKEKCIYTNVENTIIINEKNYPLSCSYIIPTDYTFTGFKLIGNEEKENIVKVNIFDKFYEINMLIPESIIKKYPDHFIEFENEYQMIKPFDKDRQKYFDWLEQKFTWNDSHDSYNFKSFVDIFGISYNKLLLFNFDKKEIVSLFDPINENEKYCRLVDIHKNYEDFYEFCVIPSEHMIKNNYDKCYFYPIYVSEKMKNFEVGTPVLFFQNNGICFYRKNRVKVKMEKSYGVKFIPISKIN